MRQSSALEPNRNGTGRPGASHMHMHGEMAGSEIRMDALHHQRPLALASSLAIGSCLDLFLFFAPLFFLRQLMMH